MHDLRDGASALKPGKNCVHWHSHWHFVTSLQRGGTCAAHGIDAENVLFLNIHFCRFRPRFGGSWASKLEPSLPFWPFRVYLPALFDLLKLSVFKKLRLGGLRARFGRPRGSILEGPGSIFTGFWTFETMPEGLSGWRTLRHRLVLHHWAVRGRKVVEILPSHRTSASNASASVS